jgi:hypothetical protein
MWYDDPTRSHYVLVRRTKMGSLIDSLGNPI